MRDHARPCRPRHRARRGGRRARSARRAGCPSRRRPRAAARRGARTAAPSAHPPAPGGGRRPREHPTARTGPGRRRDPRRAAAPRRRPRSRPRAPGRTRRWTRSGCGRAPRGRRAARRTRPAVRAAQRVRPVGRGGWDGEGAASVTDQHATRLPWRGVRTQQRPPARDSRPDGEHAAADGPRARAARRRSARSPRPRTSAPSWRPTTKKAEPRAGEGAARTSSTGRCRPATSATCRPRTAGPCAASSATRSTPAGTSGEFFLPVAAVFLVIQFALAKTGLAVFAILALYVYIIAAVDRRLAHVARPEEAPRRQVRDRADPARRGHVRASCGRSRSAVAHAQGPGQARAATRLTPP